jgi:hypothetical protein
MSADRHFLMRVAREIAQLLLRPGSDGVDGSMNPLQNARNYTLGDWHDTPCGDGSLYRFSCRHD